MDLLPNASANYTLDFRADKPANAVFEFKVAEAGGRGVRSSKRGGRVGAQTVTATRRGAV